MNTTASHVIELVKSLPLKDQQAVCKALAKHTAHIEPSDAVKQDTGQGIGDEEGIPNDDPFFQILEEDEAARRRDFGPQAPSFD
jgi:hypothetical protein